MKIQSFKADIVTTKYVKFENKSAFTKEENPEMFVCNVVINEVGRGLSKFKVQHQATLMMTPEQWEAKVIEKGDRIEFSDNATFKPDRSVEFKTYDPEKIKNYDKSQLKVDEQGKVYASSKVFPYSLRAKVGDWSLVGKYYDLNYFTIKNSGVKLPLENKEQFEQDEPFEFVLDQNEADAIAQFNGQTVLVIAYSNMNKFADKEMTVSLKRDEAGAYVLKLTQV